MQFWTRVGLLVLLVVVLAACGGDESGGNGLSEGSGHNETGQAADSGGVGEGDIDDLGAAATTHFEAFVIKDDETYFNLLSRACRERLGFATVAGHLDGRHFRAGLDGVDVTALSVADVAVEGGGDSATVVLSIDGPSGDKFREALPTTWIYEEGAWRMDDCADFREAQGGLEGQGVDRSNPVALGIGASVSGWLVVVTYITPDADELIVDTGGSPASDGKQLFAAQLNIGYDGAESSVVYGDELAYAMVSGDTVYGDEADCLTPDNGLYIDPNTEVSPGEDFGIPYVCREVASDDVPGLLLLITHIPTGDERWFSLDES